MNLPKIIDLAKDPKGLRTALQGVCDDYDWSVEDYGPYVFSDEEWADYASAKALIRFCKKVEFKVNHREDILMEHHCAVRWNAYANDGKPMPLILRKMFRRMWE